MHLFIFLIRGADSTGKVGICSFKHHQTDPCMHAKKHANMHARLHTNMHACSHAFMLKSGFMHACMHACMRACRVMSACMHACMVMVECKDYMKCMMNNRQKTATREICVFVCLTD